MGTCCSNSARSACSMASETIGCATDMRPPCGLRGFGLERSVLLRALGAFADFPVGISPTAAHALAVIVLDESIAVVTELDQRSPWLFAQAGRRGGGGGGGRE